MKVNKLRDEVFKRFDPNGEQVEDGKPFIKKEQLREFIMEIMREAEEFDAWDEKDFDDGYCQIDKDRGGTID